VASQHAEIVKRLQEFIARMDADLGIAELGPGVRPPGRVADPQPLLLPGTKIIDEPAVAAPPANKVFANPRVGDVLDHLHGPQVARRPLTIVAEVVPQSADGVIVAQGGSSVGYSLYLHHGQLAFTVREKKKPVTIIAKQTPAGRLAIVARLAADGTMTLTINKGQAAAGRAPGWLPAQPRENFCIGFDDGQPLGSVTMKRDPQPSHPTAKNATSSSRSAVMGTSSGWSALSHGPMGTAFSSSGSADKTAVVWEVLTVASSY
jgi:hypothetical protein